MIKQGSAALRIVAIAVAIAIVIGFASVMFQVSASAETADDVVSQLGTLGNYGCFKYTAGQHVSFEFLRDIYQTSNAPYVVGVVFGYKDGKFVSISKTDTRILLGARSSSDSSLVMSFCSVKLYEADYPDKYDTMYQYFSVYNSGLMYGTTSFKSKNGVKDSSGFKTLADTYSDYVNKFGSTCYAVYTTSSTKWTDSQFVTFQNEIVSNLTDSDYKDIDSGKSSTAKFITCASFTNADGSFPLWVKDFIAEGHQYPMFTFAISDNGNNHKYSMVLSYNDNDLIAPFIVGMYDDLSDSDKRTGFKLTTAISKKFHVPGFVGITNMSDVLKKGCINIFEKNWVNLTYNRAFNLNSSDLDFTENTGNKVYTITLSDYSAIKANTFYKAELIDLTTSEVLDVTYFTSAQSFNKSDSGNGTKIYDYGDKSDQMWDDLKNNTPSVDPSKGDNFNVGGDVDTNFDNLSNLNINDIISGLRTSISSVSVFFQACWSLFPAAFWSIILLGVSLIIILRILGR